MHNREIEVKFLQIDKARLIEKLLALKAQDFGEELITEQIFHDSAGLWLGQNKFGRIRKTSGGVFFTYKHSQERTATGVVEIEFKIDDAEKMKTFLEAIGLTMDRENEKLRHKFKLGAVVVDIDTWPKVPTYVELEGPSEIDIKNAAITLGYEYADGVFGTASQVIEEMYKIPVNKLRYFTFDRME